MCRRASASGSRLGDLFDVDTAFRREHEERLLLAAVERDREVVLALDVGGLLDPDTANDVPLNVHAEDVSGAGLGVVRALGELDSAGLSAATGEHLRLHDDLAAELPAAARASSGVVASRPSDTGIPKRAKSCFP